MNSFLKLTPHKQTYFIYVRIGYRAGWGTLLGAIFFFFHLIGIPGISGVNSYRGLSTASESG